MEPTLVHLRAGVVLYSTQTNSRTKWGTARLFVFELLVRSLRIRTVWCDCCCAHIQAQLAITGRARIVEEIGRASAWDVILDTVGARLVDVRQGAPDARWSRRSKDESDRLQIDPPIRVPPARV